MKIRFGVWCWEGFDASLINGSSTLNVVKLRRDDAPLMLVRR